MPTKVTALVDVKGLKSCTDNSGIEESKIDDHAAADFRDGTVPPDATLSVPSDAQGQKSQNDDPDTTKPKGAAAIGGNATESKIPGHAEGRKTRSNESGENKPQVDVDAAPNLVKDAVLVYAAENDQATSVAPVKEYAVQPHAVSLSKESTAAADVDNQKPLIKDPATKKPAVDVSVIANSEKDAVQSAARKLPKESTAVADVKNEHPVSKDSATKKPDVDDSVVTKLEEDAVETLAGEVSKETSASVDAKKQKPQNHDSASKEQNIDNHAAQNMSHPAEGVFPLSDKKIPPPHRECKAVGCIAYRKGRCEGYCLKHFMIFEPDQEKVKIVLAFKQCKTEGCNKNKISNCEGFCTRCYKTNKAVSDATNAMAGDIATKVKATPTAPAVKKVATKRRTSTTPATKKVATETVNLSRDATKVSTKRKPSKKKPCKLEGCASHPQTNCDGYCRRHSKFASQLSAPLPTKSQSQKSLRPILKARSAIYAAYWPPDDVNRITEPEWYPGVVSSVRVGKVPSDIKYGQVRYYNVNYDDGDVLKNIPDHFVFAAEEYLLQVNHDEAVSEGKKKPWRGVKNTMDKRSKDQWAKCIGWYVATIEGEKYSFSDLSDALKAYDASVVRAKGVKTRESELNLPEDWDGLLTSEGKKSPEPNIPVAGKGRKRKCVETPKGNKAAKTENPKIIASKTKTSKGNRADKLKKLNGNKAAKGGKSEDQQISRPTASSIKTEQAKNIGPLWTREILQTQQGVSIREYISPFGKRFKTVADAKNFAKLQKQKITEGVAITNARKPTAAKPANDKARAKKLWTLEETELIIKLDEQFDGCKPGDKYSRMAEKLPRFDSRNCAVKIRKLRKEIAMGKKIGSVLGLLDIKTTLANWTKQEIDRLIQLEEQHKDEEEDVKNTRIAHAIPRWDSDKCSIKTLYMRWEARVREEEQLHESRRRALAERKRKMQELAPKKSDHTSLKIPGGDDTVKAKSNLAVRKEGDSAIPASALAHQSKKQKNASSSSDPPSESKIDAKFVKILNNDPYLLSRCVPQTIEALEDKKLKSKES